MASFPSTKFLTPLPRRDHLLRPQLQQWLETALPDHRLIVIRAPAGYGKTTLLASLPTILPEFRVAWLTLDADDNDSSRFLAAIAGALAPHLPEFHEIVEGQFLPAGIFSGMQTLQQAFNVLVNVAAVSEQPLVLIFDDLHLVTNPAIFVALDHLIDHLPEAFHVAISTRHTPPLRLSRWRARRQVAEITMEDLRFDEDESRRLYNDLFHLDLTDTNIHDLQSRTEGWPAGLILLTNHLRSHRQVALTEPIVSDTFDFFAEEVLAEQPESLRAFLLDTSILDDVTPSLCDQLTGRGDASVMLDTIAQRNLFLTLVRPPAEGQEPIYRYHALFAEFLRRELARVDPDRMEMLHWRAAHALSDPARVVAHLLAAHDYDEATTLLEAIGEEYIQQGLQETLLGWIAGLPPAMRARRHRLLYLEGYAHLFRGEVEATTVCMEQSRALFTPDAHERAEEVADRARVIVALASLAFIQAQFARCDELLTQLAPAVMDAQAKLNFHMLRASLALFIHTDAETATSDVRAAIVIAQATDDLRLWYQLSLYLGPEFSVLPGVIELIEGFCRAARERYGARITPLRLGVQDSWSGLRLRRGQLRRAIETGLDALNAQGQLGGYVFLGINAAATLVAASIALEHYSAAETYLGRVLMQVEQAPLNHALMGGGLYLLGRLRLRQGRHDEVRQAIGALAQIEPRLPHIPALQQMLAAQLDFAEGHHVNAEKRLLVAIDLQVAAPVSEMYGSARVLLALLYYRWDKLPQALRQMEFVFAQVEVNGCPGVIALDMPMVAPLVRLAAQRGISPQVAMSLLTEVESASSDHPLEDALLTARQMEVLRLIAAGSSNQAIADHLTLSLATIKSHIVHIMNRLGATSRTEAVALARQRGIL